MKITRNDHSKFTLEEDGNLWHVAGFFEKKSGKLWIHLPDALREKYHRKDIQGIPETELPIGSTIEITVGEKNSASSGSTSSVTKIEELASYLSDEELDIFMSLYEKALGIKRIADEKKKYQALLNEMREKFTAEELAAMGITIK